MTQKKQRRSSIQEKKDLRCSNEKKSKLKEKVFIERQSLLSELFEVTHIKNIRYIFVAFLLTLCINHIAEGILRTGRFSLHLNVLHENFSDAFKAIQGWFIMFTVILLVHPLFNAWLYVRIKMRDTDIFIKSWDALWITTVLYFYIKLFQWTGEYTINNNLSFTSSFTLCVETTRLLMKTHSFIRELAGKFCFDEKAFKMCTFCHYFEFLFFPTLVYRDSYPRTKSINWANVLIYGGEICAAVLFQSYLFNLYFRDNCEFLKSNTYKISDIIWFTFQNTIPALGHMILTFYLILHSWQNFFGELTRFADRQFYQDWWNSTSYDEYYRKWNIVVHDWLYNYIYKDAFEFLTPKSVLLPKILVFFISAIVHEYVIYYTVRMFYPVLLFIFFTFAMLFTSFRTPKYWLFNVLFIYGIGFGVSITLTAYTTEYCIRKNPCATKSNKFPFDWMYSATFFSDCIN